MALKLILFDVDGTLVDSQAAIVGAMNSAFASVNLETPDRPAILSIVGLSLPQAMMKLADTSTQAELDTLVERYKTAYHAARMQAGVDHSPLYPGTRDVLAELRQEPEYLLGVATGKSKRGLDGLLEVHQINDFVTKQVADHHPSKPHPSMIMQAMAETGVSPEDTVMIGDTRFDMDMARAAGVRGIGVSWGYHPAERLGGDFLIRSFSELPILLQRIWRN